MNINIDTVTGGFIGFFSSVLAEPLRRWISAPQLDLECIPLVGENAAGFLDWGRSPFKQKTTLTSAQRIFVRAKVVNREKLRKRLFKPLATQCRVNLMSIQIEEKGRFRPSDYHHGLQLKWLGESSEGYGGIEIPYCGSRFVDLFYTEDGSIEFYFQTSAFPESCRYLLQGQRKLRIFLELTADNIRPVIKSLDLEWQNAWNHFGVNGQLIDEGYVFNRTPS